MGCDYTTFYFFTFIFILFSFANATSFSCPLLSVNTLLILFLRLSLQFFFCKIFCFLLLQLQHHIFLCSYELLLLKILVFFFWIEKWKFCNRFFWFHSFAVIKKMPASFFWLQSSSSRTFVYVLVWSQVVWEFLCCRSQNFPYQLSFLIFCRQKSFPSYCLAWTWL